MTAEREAVQRLAADYDLRIDSLPDGPDKAALVSIRRDMDRLWSEAKPTREQIDGLNHLVHEAERRAGKQLHDAEYESHGFFTRALVPPETRHNVVKLHQTFVKREEEVPRLFDDLAVAQERGDDEAADEIWHAIRLNAFKGAFAGLGSSTLMQFSRLWGLGTWVKDPLAEGVKTVAEFFKSRTCQWFVDDQERDLSEYKARRQAG